MVEAYSNVAVGAGAIWRWGRVNSLVAAQGQQDKEIMAVLQDSNRGDQMVAVAVVPLPLGEAGQSPTRSGNGGAGTASSISGSSVYYAGGGGGAYNTGNERHRRYRWWRKWG